MNNRVYGVVGIKSIMSNWNADFTGRCKTTSNGDIYGSDKAFKYPIKKMWECEDENAKVLYVKSYKQKGNEIQPRDLEERYEQIFGEKIEKNTPKEQVFKNLFSAIDVKNFGATFASKNCNISITGAVQVGQGYNKYNDTNIEVQDILSPFRDSTSEDAKNSTLGTKVVADEVHYMYPFAVNPKNYDIYKEIYPEGYTKEDYEKFKKACLVAATSYNTNSKIGCENELAIFVECKENSKLYLANLDQYITFEKGETLDKIDITKLIEILNNKIEEIDNIEIYYNKYTTELVGCNENCKVKSLY